jgi:hypothetical protein
MPRRTAPATRTTTEPAIQSTQSTTTLISNSLNIYPIIVSMEPTQSLKHLSAIQKNIIEVNRLLPALVNNYRVYLTQSNNNKQVLHIGTRDEAEVLRIAQKIRDTGIASVKVYKVDETEGPVYNLDLNSSLEQLLAMLQKNVERLNVETSKLNPPKSKL